MRFVLLTLFLAVGLTAAENSEPPAEQVKRLLRSAIAESKKTHDYGTENVIQILESMEGRGPIVISVIGPIRTEPTEYSLTATIDEIEILSRSPKIQADCRALRPKLRAEMEAQDTLLAAKIRQGVTDALRQSLDAKSAKDIQAPLAAVEKLLDYGHIHGESKTYEATEGARFQIPNLLRQMQEVLSADGKPSYWQWTKLNIGCDLTGYMDRSEYLARFAQFRLNNGLPRFYDSSYACYERLLQIVRDIPSPAGIANALEQLEGLYLFDSYNAQQFENPTRETRQALQSYQQVHRDLVEGWATKIDIGASPIFVRQLTAATFQENPVPESLLSNRANIAHELIRLRNQLVLLALPRVLGLPKTKAASPTETVPAYLQRIANQAQRDSDWGLLLRTLETQQTLRVGVAASVENSIEALHAFFAGLSYEQDNNYVASMQSFEIALQTGSQIPPAELVGEHLERLKKKHAPDFARAMSAIQSLPRYREPVRFNITSQSYERPPESAQVPPILIVPAKAGVK